jgi:molybdopterin molybdotransferase
VVTVRIPKVLSKYASGLEFVEVDGSTIDEVLHAVVGEHPDLEIRLIEEDGRMHGHLSLFHEGRLIPRADHRATAVQPGDQLDVLISISGGAEDIRMRGFRHRVTVEEALEAALAGTGPRSSEDVGVEECAGRVLAGDVVSPFNVPAFRRATMDGYAVQAEDTFGSSAYNPLALDIVGESLPGSVPQTDIESGTAMRIMTGAPIPEGADAVLRAEDATERVGVVEVQAPVARDRNIGRIGEDIEVGDRVLQAGRRLLPQDVGLLSSIGHDPVSVVRRPVVRVIVSGDELLDPGETPDGTSIIDSNSPMLAALVRRDGGTTEVLRLTDDRDAMRAALAAPGADVIVTAGAASVGTEDRVPLLVAELGELKIHGVAMRPSSPTGVGRIGDVPVLILPGNPVSCLVAYDFFAGPVIRRLGGLPESWPYRKTRLPLRKRLVSQIGRTDYARVVVSGGTVESLAISGASVLSSVTRASGFVIVPAGLEGYAEGAEVDVHLYDRSDPQ